MTVYLKILTFHFDRDTDSNTSNTDKALEDLGLLEKASAAEKAVVRHLCWALTHRATQFISACKSQYRHCMNM